MKAAERRRKGKTFEEVRILGKFAKVLGMQLQMFLSGSSRCRRRPSLVRLSAPEVDDGCLHNVDRSRLDRAEYGKLVKKQNRRP